MSLAPNERDFSGSNTDEPELGALDRVGPHWRTVPRPQARTAPPDRRAKKGAAAVRSERGPTADSAETTLNVRGRIPRCLQNAELDFLLTSNVSMRVAQIVGDSRVSTRLYRTTPAHKIESSSSIASNGSARTFASSA